MGWTYPQHLSVSHAGARIYMARTFKYKNGVLLPTNDVIVPSPMATLDVLVKAGRDGNRPEMKRLCATANVLRKFRLITSELNDCNWRVGDNGSDNTTLFATEPKLGFRFRNVGGQWKLWDIRHAVHPE